MLRATVTLPLNSGVIEWQLFFVLTGIVLLGVNELLKKKLKKKFPIENWEPKI